MYICELTCGHSVEVKKPTNGAVSEERCPTHNAWCLVIRYTRTEWHSVCHAPRCRYSRSHGQAKAHAERAATAHAAKTGHVVSVLYYNRARPNLRPSDITTEIPNLFDFADPTPDPADEPPPF